MDAKLERESLVREVDLLRREREGLMNRIAHLITKDKCVSCRSKPKVMLTYPCSHRVLCKDCCEIATECPICQEKIEKSHYAQSSRTGEGMM